MDDNINNKNKNNNKITTIDKIVMLPIILIMAVLPLITYFKEFNNGLSTYNWFETVAISNDFYIYYKHYFFLLLTGIMFVIYICLYRKYKSMYPVPKYFILYGIYIMLALLSSILAINKKFSFFGGFSQFESFFALFGYIVIIFYIYHLFNKETMFRIVFRCLSIGVLMVVIYGLFQFSGNDILFSKLGEKLFLPLQYQNGNIKFTNLMSDHIASTLYNPNYLGVYSSLLLPLYLVFTFKLKEKKDRILSIIVVVGLLFTLYGSNSAGGQIAFFVTFVLFMFFIFNSKVYLKRNVLISMSVCVVVAIVVGAYGLVKYIEPRKTVYNIKQIDTEEEVIVNYKDNYLHLSYEITDNNTIGIYIKDSNGENVRVSFDESTYQYTILDERFQGIKVFLSNYGEFFAITAEIDENMWHFYKLEDNTYAYINLFGKVDKIETAETAIFDEHTPLASTRGFIWSRSIPLLKDNILVGVGPDNFVFEFPQDDYVGLINNNYLGTIVTKPHSLYLQIGVQTGVISLIIFIIVILIYLVKSLQLLINCKYDSYYEKIALGCFLGVISYLISGIANDSSIAVAPLFWVIYAVGIKVNTLIAYDRSDNSN